MNHPLSVRLAGTVLLVTGVTVAGLVSVRAETSAPRDHDSAPFRRALEGRLKTAGAEQDKLQGFAPLGPTLGAAPWQQTAAQKPLPPELVAGLKSEPISLAKGRLPIGLARVFDPAIVINRDTAPAATWTALPNGWRIYSVAVESPGALGMRLHLEAVTLPRGARLLVYDPEDPARVTSPIAAEAVPHEKEIWVETLFADKAVLECQVPPGVGTAEVSFAVTGLSHVYRLPSAVAQALYDAGACNNDVTCYPQWAQAAAGVAELTFVDQGTNYLCTGCLLNHQNTNNPADYFLTAHHCIPDQAVAGTLEWFWFYQTRTCHGTPPSMYTVPHTGGGADLLATSTNSDFAFLQLRHAPPAGVYYLGWSREGPLASDTLTLISHPSGDFKRISFGNQVGVDASFRWVQWFSGVSEPGSSGGPLLNPNHQVIGQLWGGSSACDNLGGLDAFGRFDLTYQAIQSWIDPLYALRGTYRGLFQPTNGVPPLGMGALTLTLTPMGNFSGQLRTGSARYGFTGLFDGGGNAQVTAHGAGTNTLALVLHLDVVQGTERITGSVRGQGWIAGLLADRAVYGGAAPVPPQAGRYTLVLPGKPGSLADPAGDSYATVFVDKAGHAQINGLLTDGTVISQSTAVSKYGQVPLYVPLYGDGGFVMGWATFTNTAQSALSGQVTWVKPQSEARYYPNGFVYQTRLLGSGYSHPAAGQPVLGFVNAALALTGGDPAQSFTNDFTLKDQTQVNMPMEGLRLSFTPATGIFRGSLAQAKPLPPLLFSGVMLTNQSRGFGSFLAGGLSGQVVLEPAP